MKRRRFSSWMFAALLALTPVALAPLADLVAQEAQEVKWRADYNAARKESQEKGLPLLLDFGTEDCYWCKELDRTTFRDGKVVAVMNERFIPLKIDAEREKKLAGDLNIRSYPTIVLAGPDGTVLQTIVGYKAAGEFGENLQRTLAKVGSPDWMQRDLQMAQKWSASGDYPRALTALKMILEDGGARPVQGQAKKLLADIEKKAGEKLAQAKQLQEKGQTAEAIEALTETIRNFGGLPSAREATDLLTKVAQGGEQRKEQRSRRAQELLVQARDFYKGKDYVPCLDRCELLVAQFGDLQEGQEGAVLAADIKNNPEWLQNAADTMSERLGSVYLALADSLLKKGQPQRAQFYLQRVIQAFPGSRQAESAQIRLGQLQGTPPRQAEIQSARP